MILDFFVIYKAKKITKLLIEFCTMKKIMMFFCVIAFVGCKSKKSVVEKVEAPKIFMLTVNEIDNTQKAKAYSLGKRVLMTCNTSKFTPFSASEATDDVRRNTTQERLTETCHKFRLKYGSFKDLKLAEVWLDNSTGQTVYRFKADYTKPIANKELRVFMNNKNQVAAIKSLDWKPGM